MRTRLVGLTLLSVALSLQALAADSLQPLDIHRVKVGGEIGRRIDVTLSNNLLALNADKDFLAAFQAAPSSRRGEYIGLGKLIDAAVRLAAYTGDTRALALKKHLVDSAIAAQEPDGYIGTMSPKNRIFKLWDIHEMGYLVYGLSMDHRFFGEKGSLDAARKLADYIIQGWTSQPDKDASGGIALHVAVTGIENAMLALNRETGDARYLDFVTRFRKLHEWEAPIVIGRWGGIPGHVYAYLCRCTAQLRLNRLQPDSHLLRASHGALNFMMHGNAMTVAGEVGDHECWHNTQEGTMNLGETCATAYLVRWLDELLRLEGSAVYGDLMERVIYNGLFAAQSPDGRRIRYYTPDDGPRTYHKGDTYCCPNNYRRTIAELPAFVYYRSGTGLLVNLYAPGEAIVELKNGNTVRVQQETDYPNSGRVILTINPSQPAKFPLRLRIPRWCSEPKISVNGTRTQTATPGEYLTLQRIWQSGDRVEMDLPMPVRMVAGRVAQAGRVAIMRGPQVFSLNRSHYPELEKTDLRLLVIDTKSLEGPFPDDSVRPGGLMCRVNAWPAGAWYPGGKASLKLQLTEYADPGAEFTYFKVPNPREPSIRNDELLAGE